MVSINTNLQSLIVQKNLTKSTNALDKAIERLTTGYKINHASDNAANYSITRNMSSQLSSYLQAEENTSMGLDLIQTQSSTLDTIQNLTTRLRALAEQAHNGTYGAQSLQAINQEAEAIVQEIDRISKNAEYNGIKLFDNSTAQKNLEAITHDGFLKQVTHRDTSSMTTLASVKGTKISETVHHTVGGNGTYSISTAEELIQLAEMVNGTQKEPQCMDGLTFVLANDIDMSGYDWKSIADDNLRVYQDRLGGRYVTDDTYFWGTLDGNGYTISNLSGESLFGRLEGTVKNLKIENSDINGTGVIAGCANWDGGKRATISNCSIVNSSVVGEDLVGGIVGMAISSIIEDCYFTGNITATSGMASGITNYIESNMYSQGDTKISNVGVLAEIDGKTATNILFSNAVKSEANAQLSISNLFYDASLNSGANLYSESPTEITATDLSGGERQVMQVGIGGDESSQIEFSTGYKVASAKSLISGSLESAGSLENIDKFIEKISSYQTSLGAQENRMMSALESINVKIENLTSSRSTLQDADVAKESSNFIKSQILQQASATLLATANQTPQLTLRLLNSL